MNAEESARASERTGGSGGDSAAPTEEELRAIYEAELSRITSAEVMLQAAVSLLNVGGRRLGLTGGRDRSTSPEPEGGEQGTAGRAGGAGAERDLEQVHDAIEGVRALLAVLERRLPQELRPLRDALAQLQLAYARERRAGAAGTPAGGEGAPGGPRETPASPPGAPAGKAPAGQVGESEEEDRRSRGPGPAESSGRLWVPGR
jgi:hypothetical protein